MGRAWSPPSVAWTVGKVGTGRSERKVVFAASRGGFATLCRKHALSSAKIALATAGGLAYGSVQGSASS